MRITGISNFNFSVKVGLRQPSSPNRVFFSTDFDHFKTPMDHDQGTAKGTEAPSPASSQECGSLATRKTPETNTQDGQNALFVASFHWNVKSCVVSCSGCLLQ